MSEDPRNHDFRFVYSNVILGSILRAKSIRGIAKSWNLRYFGHICKDSNTALTKNMFAEPHKRLYRDPWKKIAAEEDVERLQLLKMIQTSAIFQEFCKKLQEYEL